MICLGAAVKAKASPHPRKKQPIGTNNTTKAGGGGEAGGIRKAFQPLINVDETQKGK
jgi:hypothetical protein